MTTREAAAVFGQNLKRLCAREESIAAVCRATRINRQQFNRYLAGASVPNADNLKKLCRHFGVPRAEFFRKRRGIRSVAPPAAVPQRPLWSPREAADVMRRLYSETRPSIAAGLYFVDFAELGEQDSILRCVMAVRYDQGLATFRRLTGRTERRGSWWSQFRGDHRGIVIERAQWLYFTGVNFGGVGETSQMVLRWTPGANPVLSGVALVNTARGPGPIAVVIRPCPERFTLRRAMEDAHVYQSDDSRIDPLALEALEDAANELTATTRRLDLKVHPRRSAGKRRS